MNAECQLLRCQLFLSAYSAHSSSVIELTALFRSLLLDVEHQS